MARLAYRKPGRCTARAPATRSAQPRNPPPGSGSLSPSVKLSPRATNASITGTRSSLSGIRTMMHTSPMRTRFARTARLSAAALTGGVLAVTAGCSGSGGGGTSAGSAPPVRTLAPDPGGGTDPDPAWPTYGRDFARSGVAVGVARPGPLSVSWRARLDGAVYGQPLLVGHLVIAATENDSVYALDQATGKVAWRTHVGTPVPRADLPCGNIDPLGITGTPVYNASNGLVYAVAETRGYHHVLVGVSVRDGR